MITREEILEFAGQWTLTPPIVEKDYVIGWLLHGIYQHPSLSSDLLFKGGHKVVAAIAPTVADREHMVDDHTFFATDGAFLASHRVGTALPLT